MDYVFDRLAAMFARCESDLPPFPPTLLYEEGWMLCLVLDWSARHPGAAHPLCVGEGARWYSEARLPSAFLPRYRGDPLAEGWTHADGVAGDIAIGSAAASDLVLRPEARRFKVFEAKMSSKLSAGTTRAPYYDQAARNVACMAEVLRLAGVDPASMEALSFSVVAPASQVAAGIFDARMDKASLERTVRRRVAEYDAPKDEWLARWFLPTLERAAVECVSWEDLLEVIRAEDAGAHRALSAFYERCLFYNRAEKAGLEETGQD